MKKHFSLWFAFLFAGYAAGAQEVPMTEGFLVYALLIFVAGFWGGRTYAQLRHRVKHRKKSESFRLFGFEIRRAREEAAEEPEPKRAEVLELVKPAKQEQAAAAAAACDFCQGDNEIRIAGTKDIIPCPKCKPTAAVR